MKKRIICTVINDLSYDQRMIRICETLVAAGYDVKLIGRIKKKSVALVPRSFQQYRIKCFFFSGKLFYLEYNIRLFFYLLFQKKDIINAVDLDTILPAYFNAIINKKIKLVYDAHEYFTELPEIVERPLTHKIWLWIERFSLPKIKNAYTVCQSIADIFKKEYHTHFEVIRNVPFRYEFNIINKKEKKIILYQGSLNDGRGIEQMIDAMEQIEGAELHLAGEGELSDYLREKTANSSAKNRIVFLGYLQPEELKKQTLQAYIGINLLENKGLNYYYSLANKTFDYIQALVPAINMDFPEYQNLNKAYKTSILIPNLDEKNIVDAIKLLLEDKKIYNQLVDNCRIAREEYVWEKERTKLINFYNTLK